MGILEQILSKLTGGAGGTSGGLGGLLKALMGLLNNPQSGGLAGLLKLLQQKGLGNAAASWVGTGANEPVTGSQLASALGEDKVQEIAEQSGITPEQASEDMAQYLPKIIDHLTPDGKVPDEAVLKQALAQMQSQWAADKA